MTKTGEDTSMDGQHAPDGTQTVELARAYAAAHYFVTIGNREWLFGVGQPATDIERQLGASSYLFITAWNPAPEAASVAENMEADQRLQARLRDSGYSHHSALGSNAQGGAVEYGWVVLDVPLQTADAWAREFGQAGTLYWQQDEPVRLRMLWPRPQDLAEHDFTDWA